MAKNLAALDRLISCLGRLPGIGRRSAQRMAISLVTEGDSLREDLIGALSDTAKEISFCALCGGLTHLDENPCRICTDVSRDGSVLCVVESPSDVLLIEKAGGYRGRYHVLMSRVSPMNKKGIDDIRLKSLIGRLDSEPIREVILALNYDVESDATASLIRDMIGDRQVRLSRPAMGLPAGGGIAYSDAVTLARAIRGRERF